MSPRSTALACACACLLLGGCPPESELADAGPDDAARSDLGIGDVVASDASAPDLSSADDAGVRDAALPDTAGHDVPTGTDAGACPSDLFDVCDGIAPSASSHTLDTVSHGLSGDHSISVGATRAEVTTELSGVAEIPAPFNAFAIILCSEGLILYFADNLQATNTADEGILSGDDTLYKITAFGDFNGATGTSPSLSLGDDEATMTAALGAADFSGNGISISGQPGQYRFYYAGVSVLLTGGSVATVSVFGPQSPTGTLDADVDFSSGAIGAVSVDHDVAVLVPYATGSRISEIRTAFGQSPEAEGDTTVTLDSGPYDILVLSYSALGVRFSGPESQSFPPPEATGDQRKVFTAILTAPFQGKDSGVGIGSARADVEALLGQPYASETDAEGRTLHKYDAGGQNTGVIYAVDTDCVERAALFLVNLIEAN